MSSELVICALLIVILISLYNPIVISLHCWRKKNHHHHNNEWEINMLFSGCFCGARAFLKKNRRGAKSGYWNYFCSLMNFCCHKLWVGTRLSKVYSLEIGNNLVMSSPFCHQGKCQNKTRISYLIYIRSTESLGTEDVEDVTLFPLDLTTLSVLRVRGSVLKIVQIYPQDPQYYLSYHWGLVSATFVVLRVVILKIVQKDIIYNILTIVFLSTGGTQTFSTGNLVRIVKISNVFLACSDNAQLPRLCCQDS